MKNTRMRKLTIIKDDQLDLVSPEYLSVILDSSINKEFFGYPKQRITINVADDKNTLSLISIKSISCRNYKELSEIVLYNIKNINFNNMKFNALTLYYGEYK